MRAPRDPLAALLLLALPVGRRRRQCAKRHPITGHGIAPEVVATARSPGAPARTDPELELAFEVVKAAGIIERGARDGGSVPIEAALGRCEVAT
jgi:hypothetical protein